MTFYLTIPETATHITEATRLFNDKIEAIVFGTHIEAQYGIMVTVSEMTVGQPMIHLDEACILAEGLPDDTITETLRADLKTISRSIEIADTV